MNEIEFPWFDPILNPNRKCHWSIKSKARKKQRREAYYTTLQYPTPKFDTIELDIVFYPPDRTKRDEDNCLASIKGLLDGMADAWRVDDSCFTLKISKGLPVTNGKIVISYEE